MIKGNLPFFHLLFINLLFPGCFISYLILMLKALYSMLDAKTSNLSNSSK